MDLKQAIYSQDLHGLIQVHAEGVNFMETMPDQVSFDPFSFDSLILCIYETR